MKPPELKKRLFELPKHSNDNIIILTASSPRHKRFALRIQKEFPKLVVGLYEYDRNVKSIFQNNSNQSLTKKNNTNNVSNIFRYFFLNIIKLFKNLTKIKKLYNFTKHHILLKKYREDFNKIELETFDYELSLLKKYSLIESQKINPNDINKSEFCEILLIGLCIIGI
jgi:hypothetical protein